MNCSFNHTFIEYQRYVAELYASTPRVLYERVKEKILKKMHNYTLEGFKELSP